MDEAKPKTRVSHGETTASHKSYQALLTRLFSELTGEPTFLRSIHDIMAPTTSLSAIALINESGNELAIALDRAKWQRIAKVPPNNTRLFELQVAELLRRITIDRYYLKDPEQLSIKTTPTTYSVRTPNSELGFCHISTSNGLEVGLVESLVSGIELSSRALPAMRDHLPLLLNLSHEDMANLAAQLKGSLSAQLSDLFFSVELLSLRSLSCRFDLLTGNKLICRIGEPMEKRGVTVTLGAIDISAEDLLGLQPGSSIEIEKPESLTGLLQIDGVTWAEVSVSLDQERIVLTANKIVESES